MSLEKYANKIVYWRGGGYDGCIWEPNMGFLDDFGQWHPTISTGSGAIDTEDRLLEALETTKDGTEECYEFDGFKLMELNQDSVDWLARNTRVDYVAYFVDKINDSMPELEMQMVCTKCGRHFSPEDYDGFKQMSALMAESGFYRGDGGIGIITDELWCEDCIRESECQCCYEVSRDFDKGSDDHRTFREQFLHDWLPCVCDSCIDGFFYDNTECDEILDDIEERIDGLKSGFRKYAHIMRDKKHPDLHGCLEKAKQETRIRANELIDECRDKIQPYLEKYRKFASIGFDYSARLCLKKEKKPEGEQLSLDLN